MSSLYSGISLSTKFQQSHIVFTYFAVNSLKILGALDKVDKKLILKTLGIIKEKTDPFPVSKTPQSAILDLYIQHCRFVEYSKTSALLIPKNRNNISTVAITLMEGTV